MTAVSGIEAGILLWLQSIRCPALDTVFSAATRLTDGGVFWLCLCVLLLLIKKRRKAGLVGLAALAVGFLLCNVLIKPLAARTRPFEAIEGLKTVIECTRDYSFPSGHANAAFAASVAIHRETKKLWSALLIVLAVIIAISRLYLGLHYPTDVLGGIATGIVSALIAGAVGKKIRIAE